MLCDTHYLLSCSDPQYMNFALICIRPTLELKRVKLAAHYKHKAGSQGVSFCHCSLVLLCQIQTQQEPWPPLSIGKQGVKETGRHINRSIVGLFP